MSGTIIRPTPVASMLGVLKTVKTVMENGDSMGFNGIS
jgi:hypothetical protein